MNHDAVYQKVSWRLLPLLFLCYVAAYLDRVNVGFAKLHMNQALGLSEADTLADGLIEADGLIDALGDTEAEGEREAEAEELGETLELGDVGVFD